MSTRSEILVKCKYGEVKLYHHHDGYIEGVGFDLLKRFFLKDNEWFNRKNYEGKKITPHIDNVINELVKDAEDEYEVTIVKHTDIEFYYEIDVTKGTLTGWNAYYEYDEKEEKSTLKKCARYSLEEIKNLYNKYNQTKDIENCSAKIVQNSYPFSK